MDADDKALALAAASGDRAAFSALISRHHPMVFRLAWRITGATAAAEDIAQDVCVGLPAKLQTWRGEGKFTTWLHMLAVNAARDHLRREATHAKAAVGWGEAVRAAAGEQATQADRAAWLTAAMCQLPDDLRETLALITEGVSHAEAAKVLDISEGTVSWRMNRARTLLRDIHRTEEET